MRENPAVFDSDGAGSGPKEGSQTVSGRKRRPQDRRSGPVVFVPLWSIRSSQWKAAKLLARNPRRASRNLSGDENPSRSTESQLVRSQAIGAGGSKDQKGFPEAVMSGLDDGKIGPQGRSTGSKEALCSGRSRTPSKSISTRQAGRCFSESRAGSTTRAGTSHGPKIPPSVFPNGPGADRKSSSRWRMNTLASRASRKGSHGKRMTDCPAVRDGSGYPDRTRLHLGRDSSLAGLTVLLRMGRSFRSSFRRETAKQILHSLSSLNRRRSSNPLEIRNRSVSDRNCDFWRPALRTLPVPGGPDALRANRAGRFKLLSGSLTFVVTEGFATGGNRPVSSRVLPPYVVAPAALGDGGNGRWIRESRLLTLRARLPSTAPHGTDRVRSVRPGLLPGEDDEMLGAHLRQGPRVPPGVDPERSWNRSGCGTDRSTSSIVSFVVHCLSGTSGTLPDAGSGRMFQRTGNDPGNPGLA